MKRFDVEATRGRWPSILTELGVDEKTLSKRNVPCPFCGGKDRFRFTDHEGMGLWLCNVCGTGNGMQFVEKYARVGFVAATKLVEATLPHTSITSAAPKAPPRARLNKLWSMASYLSADDPVGEYLLTRGVWTDEPLHELRFAESVPYFSEGSVTGHYHAMLARVRDGSGKPTTLHCTYLSGAGKADVPSPKKVMSAMGHGAAIRLFKEEPVLAIAEGIETALAVFKQTGYPVWAAISAGGMKSIVLPEIVREVLIYADNDESYTGQAAAYALAQRMVAEGRRADVFMPNNAGLDFADEGAW